MIYHSFYNTKIHYREQHKQCNNQIKKLKSKKAVSVQLLKDLINEKNRLPKPELKANLKIESLKQSIQELEYKTAILNAELEQNILNIEEENKLLEEINRLQIQGQIISNNISELEQKTAEEIENSDYFKIENLIETLQDRVNKIDNIILQLTNSRISNHKEFLTIYREIRIYEELKSKIENDFHKNINLFEQYNKIFVELDNFNYGKLYKEIYIKNQSKRSVKSPKTKKSEKTRLIVQKKKLLKKLKKDRLKRALEKRDSGKKLDFYELKLIMDQDQKRK